MTSRVLTGLISLAMVSTLISSPVAQAQQTRDERLRAGFQAYDDLDPARAQTLLRGALNPAEGPQDSLWQRGVQLLAQMLVEEDRGAEAQTWLRWGFRLAPTMVIDTVTFLPDVVTAARAARTAAGAPGAGDAVTRTSWEWTAPGVPAGQGRIRVLAPNVGSPVNALVQGGVVLQSGGQTAVAAGTYSVQAAAENFLPAQVTREVLPGITTVLQFDLVSAAAANIAENVRAAAFRQLVPLNVQRFQTQPACGTGAYVSRDGLVITSYQAIRGAEAIEARTGPDRTVRDELRVAAWDVANNLAVLVLPVSRTDSLPLATQPPASGFVWALGLRGCSTAADIRTRVAAQPVGARLDVADSLNPGDNAGPVIDGQGRLVAVHGQGRQAASYAAVQTLVAQARTAVAQRQTLTPAQLALRVNHAYGAVAIAADVTGATARITPIETWHWPETARSGSLPMTFTGPMGRYQLAVTFPGQTARTQEITLRAGQLDRLNIPVTPVVAEGQRGQVG
ncbi:MAG TPA: serine protease, partial [Gemmatimonadales bacterium]|nr:serine protease [Gemmatimonadales bacterium]